MLAHLSVPCDSKLRSSRAQSMLRYLYSVVWSNEDLRLMSETARCVSYRINSKLKPWVDSGIHASISPLYAHLSCRILELAVLMLHNPEEDAAWNEATDGEHKQAGEWHMSFGNSGCHL
jgi:hypothetical protein